MPGAGAAPAGGVDSGGGSSGGSSRSNSGGPDSFSSVSSLDVFPLLELYREEGLLGRGSQVGKRDTLIWSVPFSVRKKLHYFGHIICSSVGLWVSVFCQNM